MLFVVIKYQNISLLSTPGLLWLEETLEDVAKEALISLCFCPKLESLIVLSYIQEVIYLGGKKAPFSLSPQCKESGQNTEHLA